MDLLRWIAMSSDEQEAERPQGPVCLAPESLFSILEQLESHLNLAVLTRLKCVNKEFYKHVDEIISWKSRALAFKCFYIQREMTRHNIQTPQEWRVCIVKPIQKYKNRCCECGKKKARVYGQRYSVCDSCRYDSHGYRSLATRRDIQLSFGLSPYKLMMFSRHLTPVHGGICSSPYLYWRQDVIRTYHLYHR